MPLLSPFDPWRSALCSCPQKLTFNPYTGCDHKCVYCYASSYVPRFFECRPKKNLVARLAKEVAKLRDQIISISNSSDPYPNLEEETQLTRECLKVLANQNCRVQIITKSHIVTRDIDLLKSVSSMVAMTITTADDDIARLIEPCAPAPSRRLRAIENLLDEGIASTVRIDPIIPFLNDDPTELMKKVASIGVRHVTSSTCKIRPNIWGRFETALPETARKLRSLFFEEGDKIGGYRYLKSEVRLRLMKNVARLAKAHGLEFATCREGLSGLNTATCDGSWLLP